MSVFLGMTIISAVSFYALLINHAGRWWSQALLWSGLVATVWYYLP
jgi:branched-subunit amino acid transport protein